MTTELDPCSTAIKSSSPPQKPESSLATCQEDSGLFVEPLLPKHQAQLRQIFEWRSPLYRSWLAVQPEHSEAAQDFRSVRGFLNQVFTQQVRQTFRFVPLVIDRYGGPAATPPTSRR